MPSENADAIFDSTDFDEDILSFEDLETSLSATLELQLSDLSVLEKEKEKINNPNALGKVIMDEVWTQFGAQIGLDITNETLIQAYNREHPEQYSKTIGDAIMQDPKYKKANDAMKQQHKDGALVDSYTGIIMAENDKPNLDHVVPRKELYDNPRRKQAGIDTKDLANKAENLTPTNESLNKSKKEKSAQKYVDSRAKRESDLKKQSEAAHRKVEKSDRSEAEKRIEHEKIDKRLQDKLNAKDQLMLDADAKARKSINKDIAAGVTKQTAKKVGIDALKAMIIAALFDLLKSIMNGLVRFFKEQQKSFKLFLAEMKESIKRFIHHISSFVKTGVSSVIGTVISEIFGPIVSMFKKLASLIKQGVSFLIDAIHYLTAKENKDKPLSIKIAQVGKIVTAGLAAAGAIVGSELIEKALLQLPVMAVEIPFLGSIANVTGMFLASLLCGVVGAIIINLIDKYIKKQQEAENIDSQIEAGSKILITQAQLIQVNRAKVMEKKLSASQNMVTRHKEAADKMKDASVLKDELPIDHAAEFDQMEEIIDSLLENPEQEVIL